MNSPQRMAQPPNQAPTTPQPARPSTSQVSLLTASESHFRRYELLIEYKNLRHHAPAGVYVLPTPDNLSVWHGVVFVATGWYRHGAFKFSMQIPEEYPDEPPAIRFTSDMFHPLINASGYFVMQHQFDCIAHVLHYVKNAFTSRVLMNLREELCPNKEALRMLKDDKPLFCKFASQCAAISTTDEVVFDASQQQNGLRFASISDDKAESLRLQVLSGTSPWDQVQSSPEKGLMNRLSAGLRFITGAP